MFSEELVNLPFLEDNEEYDMEVALYLHGSLRGSLDESFLASARAVLSPRIKRLSGKHFQIHIYPNSINTTTIHRMNSSPISEVGDYVPLDVEESLLIVGADGGEKAFLEETFKKITDAFETGYEGYVSLPNVVEFLHQAGIASTVIVNSERRRTIVFVDRLTVPVYHFIQSAMLAYCPYFYDKEEGVTEDEMALLDALQGDSADAVVQALSRMYERGGFENRRLEKALGGFSARRMSRRIEQRENEIANKQEVVQRWIREISMLRAAIRDLQAEVRGYRMTIMEDDHNEVLEYFKDSQYLHFMRCDENEGMIEFCAADRILYFDEDEAECNILNKSSYIYEAPHRRLVSKQDMQYLMRSIFVDKILFVRTMAVYRIWETAMVYGVDNARYPAVFNGAYMPNPHIHYHHCMNENENLVVSALRDGDFILALEQCLSSARSLNFGDSTVMREFMKDLYSTEIKCVELPDGKNVTPYEAVAYLKETGYINIEQEDVNDEQDY